MEIINGVKACGFANQECLTSLMKSILEEVKKEKEKKSSGGGKKNKKKKSDKSKTK
jgi:hypothetical protein